MTTEEIDYSLPYEEYLKNFRKTHHPQERAMSRDQYKAAAEKQAKMKAAEEAGTGNGGYKKMDQQLKFCKKLLEKKTQQKRMFRKASKV